jgi:hypothetical protein
MDDDGQFDELTPQQGTTLRGSAKLSFVTEVRTVTTLGLSTLRRRPIAFSLGMCLNMPTTRVCIGL